ncbi:hypothetical protein JHK87_033217 [Glycine soja]|nr:hypothetical protein JHK87_033217 [Glycine soja]
MVSTPNSFLHLSISEEALRGEMRGAFELLGEATSGGGIIRNLLDKVDVDVGVAALCLACNRDIHSANPLTSRHERIPVTSFFESINSVKVSDADADAHVSTEEAETASWLLPNPKTDLNSSQYLFSEIEPVPYIDLDYATMDPKSEQKSSATADDIVPVQSNFESFTYKHQTSFELEPLE